MESNSQEKKNLMQDMPIDRIAGGAGSWMSKHSMAGGSPVHKGGSYKGSPAHQQKVYSDRLNKKGETQMDVINKADDAAKVAIDANNNNDSKKASKGLFDAATKANERTTFVRDSIRGANVKIDGLISKIKSGDY